MEILTKPLSNHPCVIERLEDIAFYACYKDVISSLYLCREFWVADQYNPISQSSTLASCPLFTSDNMIRYLRFKLASSLVGIVSDEVRRKLVTRFSEDTDKDSFTFVKGIGWAFMASVLDESFTELKTRLPEDGLAKVIDVVTKRSPLLKKLVLKFYPKLQSHSQKLKLSHEIGSSFMLHNSLKNLTVLSIEHLKYIQHDYFVYLGTSCPGLVDLSLIGINLESEDILNIFLGVNAVNVEYHETLFLEGCLHEFQFLPQMLTPFCNTLKRIQFGNQEYEDSGHTINSNLYSKCNCDIPSYHQNIDTPVIAFILRHVPNLASLYVPGPVVGDAVKILLQPSKQKYQWDLISEECAKISPFTGTLLLESLGWIETYDKELFEAAGQLCPLLKKVRVHQTDADHWPAFSPPDFCLSPSSIEKIWSQLQYLTLCNVDEKNQQTLMDTFGAQLIGIHFTFCIVKPNYLVKCSRLEELEIDQHCKLYPFETVPETFLPCLKKIRSDVCLREMSASFLNKSTLSHIQLECFNLFTETEEWSSIKALWPQLKTFHIAKCTGLDLRSVVGIFPLISQLRTLVLPESILDANKLLRQFENELSSFIDPFKKSKIFFRFTSPFHSKTCCMFDGDCDVSDEEDDDGDCDVSDGEDDDGDCDVRDETVDDSNDDDYCEECHGACGGAYINYDSSEGDN